MPAAGGKGKPKNYEELSDDTKALREEKQVTMVLYWLACIIFQLLVLQYQRNENFQSFLYFDAFAMTSRFWWIDLEESTMQCHMVIEKI